MTEPCVTYSQAELDAMDTASLLLYYKESGNTEAQWTLVLRYEWLIRSIALQISGIYQNFAQLEDIVSEGLITLLQALEKFEPERGIKFETYASRRIRGMIVDLARKQDWVPRSVRKRSRDIDEAMQAFYHEHGRTPTDLELSTQLGLSLQQYQESLGTLDLSHVLSLEALLAQKESAGIPSPTEQFRGPAHQLEQQEEVLILARAIETLRENEQLVLSLYYKEELSMREVAQVLEISEPRVSQIHSKAIQKLRLSLSQSL